MKRRSPVTGTILLGAALVVASGVEAQQTHLLVIGGLGGTDELSSEILEQALELRAAAVDRYGVAPERTRVLAEDPTMDAAVDGEARLDDIDAAFAELAGTAGPEDRVMVVLLGHGTFRNSEARFNLPGPDLSPEALAGFLDRLATDRIAVVNTASASGPFVEPLAAPGRTVIAATATGREQNRTRFGRFFVDAFTEEAADLDKDGAISLLEAFTFARTETARSYEEEGRLLTEHAVLEDDGDGEGIREPSIDTPDGMLASAFLLGTPGVPTLATEGDGPVAVPADSVLARLYRERTALEQGVAELRRRRSEMEAAEYDRRLEDLLLELALKSREIRDREGGGR